MSDSIKHECGIALIRLRKPLERPGGVGRAGRGTDDQLPVQALIIGLHRSPGKLTVGDHAPDRRAMKDQAQIVGQGMLDIAIRRAFHLTGSKRVPQGQAA